MSSACQYLIWSNVHRLWWRGAAQGYTDKVSDAGRYTREEAVGACRRSMPRDGGAPRELPIREADALRLNWNPATYPITESAGERR